VQLENLLNAGFSNRYYIFTDTSKIERGALFFRVMAKQGDKISLLKILNYTSPPPPPPHDKL
jgi:hypothetical protein